MEDADRPRTLSTTDRYRCFRDAAEDDESTFVVDVLYGPTCVCGVVKHRVGWVKSVKGTSAFLLASLTGSSGRGGEMSKNSELDEIAFFFVHTPVGKFMISRAVCV